MLLFPTSNAFNRIKVGPTLVTSDSKNDTVEFSCDDTISIVGDDKNDKVTFLLSDIKCGDYAY